MSSDESIWRTRVLSATMPEYVVELLDGYQHALADAAIVRGADPDAAWAEAREGARKA